MFVVDPETGEVFSLDHCQVNLKRDRLKQNKPAMKSGMDQRSFCNPNTGKCIYRENHTDPTNRFATGILKKADGTKLKVMAGFVVNPAVEKDGDQIKIKVAPPPPPPPPPV